MEFRFNVNEIFRQPVVAVDSSLIPPGFQGDRRALWDAVAKTTEVINAIGEASARAQGLSKPITTADRLRNSENQMIYLLIDQNARNGKGVVTGMLKTGRKGLYVFDKDGQHYQVTPPCVLDFYVHESRQRTGLGRQLFEHMLQKENIEPKKLAIDRPSDKFLSFLHKHYGLNQAIKQMNNYVVFDGFFPEGQNKDKDAGNNNSDTPGKNVNYKQSANGLQTFTSPYGRYGAPRPPCSMGQIIHNQSATVESNQDNTGVAPRLTQSEHVESVPSPSPAQVCASTPNMMPYGGQYMENMSAKTAQQQMLFAGGEQFQQNPYMQQYSQPNYTQIPPQTTYSMQQPQYSNQSYMTPQIVSEKTQYTYPSMSQPQIQQYQQETQARQAVSEKLIPQEVNNYAQIAQNVQHTTPSATTAFNPNWQTAQHYTHISSSVPQLAQNAVSEKQPQNFQYQQATQPAASYTVGQTMTQPQYVQQDVPQYTQAMQPATTNTIQSPMANQVQGVTSNVMQPSMANQPAVTAAMQSSVANQMQATTSNIMQNSMANQMQPAVNNTMQPAVNNTMQPTMANQMQGVTSNAMQHSMANQMQGATSNVMQHSMANQMQPAVNAMQPSLVNQMQPSVTAMQPSMANQMQPSVTAMQPSLANQMQPSVANAMQSSMANQFQPVVTNATQSPMANQMQPSVANTMQPYMANQLQPAVTTNMQPSVANLMQPAISNMQTPNPMQTTASNVIQSSTTNPMQSVASNFMQPVPSNTMQTMPQTVPPNQQLIQQTPQAIQQNYMQTQQYAQPAYSAPNLQDAIVVPQVPPSLSAGQMQMQKAAAPPAETVAQGDQTLRQIQKNEIQPVQKPYRYYDSTKDTMQQSHATHNARQGAMNASGDMKPVGKKVSEYLTEYPPQKRSVAKEPKLSTQQELISEAAATPVLVHQ